MYLTSLLLQGIVLYHQVPDNGVEFVVGHSLINVRPNTKTRRKELVREDPTEHKRKKNCRRRKPNETKCIQATSRAGRWILRGCSVICDCDCSLWSLLSAQVHYNLNSNLAEWISKEMQRIPSSLTRLKANVQYPITSPLYQKFGNHVFNWSTSKVAENEDHINEFSNE